MKDERIFKEFFFLLLSFILHPSFSDARAAFRRRRVRRNATGATGSAPLFP